MRGELSDEPHSFLCGHAPEGSPNQAGQSLRNINKTLNTSQETSANPFHTSSPNKSQLLKGACTAAVSCLTARERRPSGTREGTRKRERGFLKKSAGIRSSNQLAKLLSSTTLVNLQAKDPYPVTRKYPRAPHCNTLAQPSILRSQRCATVSLARVPLPPCQEGEKPFARSCGDPAAASCASCCGSEPPACGGRGGREGSSFFAHVERAFGIQGSDCD